MAIRDIQIARTSSANAVSAAVPFPSVQNTAPIPVPPKPAEDWSSLVQAGKGGLAADPQSGGILKILADNGFKEKIENGSASGHTYNVWHTPPSSEFVLVDTWTDRDGSMKKHYEFFKIADAAVSDKKIEVQIAPEEHPIIIALRSIERDVDQLLRLTARLA
jgi:hypothetical protein